jgi:hypothetical protein
MPLPKRKKGEKKDKFVSRCMGDSVMVKDYPDQKQRAAICYKQAGETRKVGKASIGLDDRGEEILIIE